MAKKEIKDIIEIVKKQEKKLRFDKFSNDDAYELGKFMVDKIKKDGIEMAVQIKRVNGNTLFSYFSEGTNLMNEKWMRRKFNTVVANETSSYLQWAYSELGGHATDAINAVNLLGLDEMDYVLCGGGFPIKLRTGEMVGVILASNLPHAKDHQFIVDGLEGYLKAIKI